MKLNASFKYSGILLIVNILATSRIDIADYNVCINIIDCCERVKLFTWCFNASVSRQTTPSHTSFKHRGRGNKMENNSVTRSSTNTSTSPTMTDTPSKEQGIAVVTVFLFESAIIVMGNFPRVLKLNMRVFLLIVTTLAAKVHRSP